MIRTPTKLLPSSDCAAQEDTKGIEECRERLEVAFKDLEPLVEGKRGKFIAGEKPGISDIVMIFPTPDPLQCTVLPHVHPGTFPPPHAISHAISPSKSFIISKQVQNLCSSIQKRHSPTTDRQSIVIIHPCDRIAGPRRPVCTRGHAASKLWRTLCCPFCGDGSKERGVQDSAGALSRHRRREARIDGVCRLQAGCLHLIQSDGRIAIVLCVMRRPAQNPAFTLLPVKRRSDITSRYDCCRFTLSGISRGFLDRR